MKYALPCQIYKRVNFETQPDGQTGNIDLQQQNVPQTNSIFEFLFLFTALINAKFSYTFIVFYGMSFDTFQNVSHQIIQ